MDRLQIVLPCQLRYRDAAGALIAQICERLERERGEAGLRDQVISAFIEAFNNVALHTGRPEEVQVALELDSQSLAIELRDRGEPFDYDRIPTPDLEQLPESGLGLFIMRSFMTTVNYHPGGSGRENVLRMVRKLK
jgi:serine/threonine-protein kinase RsbW